MTLTHEQKTAWERDGVLIIPGFYSEAQADLLLASLQRAWAERPHVTVDDLKLNLRMKLGHVSPQQRQDHIFKVNDLYLEFEEVRSVSLDPRMVDVLTELLGHKPVLCTTLSLERSTQQDNHIDSLYMTPITPGHLIATWIALEDVSPEAGPLRFVPGSHTLPLYTFADGSHHASNEEHHLAIAHIAAEIEKRGLQPQFYCPKKGDVLIWHANLVHGGAPINDKTLTRKSMVSHFYSETDSRNVGFDLVPMNGAHWLYRQHLAIPQPPPPPQPPAPLPPPAAASPEAPLRHRLADAVHGRLKRVVPRFIHDAMRSVVDRRTR